MKGIDKELEERLAELRGAGKLVEAQRLEQRTRFDLEMMREVGYCAGSRTIRAISPDGPPGRARPACWIIFRRTFSSLSTSRTPPCRRSAGCITATGPAS